MRRREFIAWCSSAAAWPLVARAQNSSMPVIGFLNSGTPDLSTVAVSEFRAGLKEAGFVEGQNVAVEYRWAQDTPGQLSALAAELVERKVALIASTGGSVTALAAKAATTTIPIVFSTGDDPVELGIVANVKHPGSNLTGASFYSSALAPKRLELLHELVPNVTSFALLSDSSQPDAEAQLNSIRAAANAAQRQLTVFDVKTQKEIFLAFAAMAEQGVGAFLLGTSPFLFGQMQIIAALAIRHAIPACYYERQFLGAGGLMSYGARRSDAYRQVGIYAGRILKGDKPGDLPIVFPTKFELGVNLRIARVIDIAVPATLLARADEVIE